MAERFSAVSLHHDKPGRKTAAGVMIGLVTFVLFGIASAIVGAALAWVVPMIGLLAGPSLARAFAGELEEKHVALVAEPGVLRLPGSRVFRDLRTGIDSVTAGTVVLDMADGTALRLQFPAGSDTGAQLLRALGIGEDQRTATVPLRRTIGGFTMGFVTFFAALAVLGPLLGVLMRSPSAILVSLATAIALTTLVVRRFGSPHVVIGKDGIAVRGMLGPGLYRYSDIANTSFGIGTWSQEQSLDVNGCLHLELKDGKRVELPLVAVDRERVQGLRDRLEKARIASSEGRTHLADSLRQSGQTVESWEALLTRLAHREAGFREAAVDPGDVERVLLDPAAATDARIGAAFVLTRIDAADAAKVRVAIETTADDELREALLAASRGELARRA